jgi:Ca2+-binding RTX toxin-like protein
VVEAAEPETYSIFLTSRPANPVTVEFEFDEQQIEPILPIVFDDTNWNIPQEIAVIARGEDGIEGVQQTLISHQVTSEDPNYNGFTLADIAVEIIELQSAGLLVEPTSLTVVEGGTSDSYNLSLTQAPDDIVTVQFNTGSQLNPIPDIIFDPNNWNVPQTVVVSAFDDIIVEGIHSGMITHQLISNDEDYNIAVTREVAVEITDNDEPDPPPTEAVSVQILPGNLTISESGIGTEGSYEFVLTAIPTSAVTINVTTGNQINEILPITFNETNWNIPQTVTFTAVDNAVVDGDRAINILHSISSEDERYSQLIIADVTVNITDDDTASPNPNPNPNPNDPVPTVQIDTIDNQIDVIEAGITDLYTVVLTTQPTSEVRVTITPDSQVDLGNGTDTPIELVFTPENWDISQTVTVAAEDDSVVERDVHTSTINHTVTSLDPDYGINPLITIDSEVENNLTVFIEDNDEPLPPGTPGVRLIQNARSLNVMEGFSEDTYWVSLESEPTAEVVLTVQFNDQVQTDQPTLSFTSSDWNQAKPVKVTAIDDLANEGDHSATLFYTATSLDPRYNNISIPSLSIDIADNDNLGQQLNLVERSILEFTDLDDVIIASGNDDRLSGQAGNDRLMGMAGQDVLRGQQGADGIAGDTGDDILMGGQGNDHIYGNQGNDILFGDAGSDRLFGGSGDDQISGGLGNDRLSPDMGIDTLTGGLGQDVFVLGRGTGSMVSQEANLITDFTEDQDTIELTGGLTFDQLNFALEGGGTLLQIRSSGEFIAFLSGVSLDLSIFSN